MKHFATAAFACFLTIGFAPTGALLADGHLASEKSAESPAENGNWASWRGPNETGAADPHADPPLEWSEESNVKWKVALPGTGHSTPAVWEGRVFALSAARGTEGYDFNVSAYNLEDGGEIWSKTAVTARSNERGHPTNTQASASAAADGEVVLAHFGSQGLFAYDLDGEFLWSVDLGDMETRNQFGEGSSPVIHGGTVLVLWDHEDDSFIVALDKETGDELWRKPRDEPTNWSTPLVVERGGVAQAVVNGTNRIISYDLRNGDILWTCSGMTRNVIPTPVAQDNLVYIMSGFRGSALLAIDLDAALTAEKEDLAGSDAVVWEAGSDTPYVPSPVLYDNILYYLRRSPTAVSARDALTGERLFGPVRLDGARDMIYSSPSAGGGRVYIPTREGYTFVLKAGPEYHVLKVNSLNDSFSSSPILIGKELLLRGERNLYCIREAEE